MTSRLELLLLLDQYAQAHAEGDTNFKSAIWHVTKARCKSQTLSPGDTMIPTQNLQAEWVLRQDKSQAETKSAAAADLPDLVPEKKLSDDDLLRLPTDADAAAASTVPWFSLVAADSQDSSERNGSNLNEKENDVGSSSDAGNAAATAAAPFGFHDNTTVGLRQRKKGNAGVVDENTVADEKWSVEQVVVEKEFGTKPAESASSPTSSSTRRPSPILISSGPQRELTQAQLDAQEALQAYVRAANFRRALESMLLRGNEKTVE